MGNNAYKKEMAARHNKNRAYNLKCATDMGISSNGFDSRHKASPKTTEVKMVVGEKYNFKNQSERLVYLGKNWSGNGYWHQFEKVGEPGVVWSEMQDSDLTMIELTPTLIKNWVELKAVKGSGSFTLDITPDDGNGWIRDELGKGMEYLSTHTFYGKDHEYSTGLLQKYGFNIVLANWDEK